MNNYCHYKSPLGLLRIEASDKGITHIVFREDEVQIRANSKLLNKCVNELTAYFEDGISDFTVPLDLRGTDFQLGVWNCLLQITRGETITYSNVAKQLGSLKKVRAVGTAIGRNPVLIIVPCHRVIGKNNSLTGYSGGIDRKKNLLTLESKTIQTQLF